MAAAAEALRHWVQPLVYRNLPPACPSLFSFFSPCVIARDLNRVDQSGLHGMLRRVISSSWDGSKTIPIPVICPGFLSYNSPQDSHRWSGLKRIFSTCLNDFSLDFPLVC